ncbi:MAG: hypothetical protein KDJ19_13905 [Hyphomicrobiaceae bacterium]|nr:hypothetical protein [Hyphomicrobiaceae bacterium]MCC0022980.1 hypothetical protein [Hyphomicrobiaceae bacterium]
MANKTGTSGNDTINGTNGPDNLSGLAGNDTIYGRGGNDWIIGGPGNDKLFGEGGSDVIDGVDSGDKVDGGTGSDTANFASTIDSSLFLDASLVNVEFIKVYHTHRFDFSAQTEDLNIIGDNSAQTILSGSGNDSINSGGGADNIDTGAGNDTIYARDVQSVDGGSGKDTAIFSSTVSRSNLSNADLVRVETIKVSGAHHFDFAAQSEKLTIVADSSVDLVKGGKGDDTILGWDVNLINGFRGKDKVIYKHTVKSANLLDNHLVNVETVSVKGSHKFDFSHQTEDLTILSNAAAKRIVGGHGNDTIFANDTDAINGRDDTTGDRAIFRSDVSSSQLTDNRLVNVERITVKGAHEFDFSVQSEGLEFLTTSLVKSVTGGTGNDVFIAREENKIIGGGGNDKAVYSHDVTSGVLDDNQLQNVNKVSLKGAHSFDFSAQTEALKILSDTVAKTISGGQVADHFVFIGSSASGVSTIDNFSGTTGVGDMIEISTTAASGTGINSGGFANEVVTDNSDVLATNGFNFVQDNGGHHATSLSTTDVAAFLANVNGVGTSSFQYSNADNAIYLAVTDGTNLGIFLAQSGNADQVIDANELTLIAQLQNVTFISGADLFGFV